MSSTTDMTADMTADVPADAGKPAERKSTAELVNDLTSQFSHLARTEIRLAVREVRDKAKHAGIGAASIGAAGVLALYGFAVVLTGLVLLLAMAVPAWVAALIVGAVLLLAAGIAALVARRQLRKGAPLPSEAIASARTGVHVVAAAARR